MAKELKDELTEPERRDLVRRIAARGSRGYEIMNTTAQPSYDYAAAAESAMAADPVDLPPEAMTHLTDTVTAPSGDAARYAEAQRAIFQRGQQRELAAGHEFFDDTQTQITATNKTLADYQAALAAEEAARAARQGRGGGRRRSAGGGDDEETDQPLTGGFGSGPQSPLTVEQEILANRAYNKEPQAFEDAYELIEGPDGYLSAPDWQGAPWEEVRISLAGELTRRGYSPEVIAAVMRDLQVTYADSWAVPASKSQQVADNRRRQADEARAKSQVDTFSPEAARGRGR